MTEKYTPEKVAELVAEARYTATRGPGSSAAQFFTDLADALTAVSAERDATIQRMRDAERVADARRQTIATYEQKNAAWELQFHVAERGRDRLHKAIEEALAAAPKLGELRWRNVDRVIGILRAALDKEKR